MTTKLTQYLLLFLLTFAWGACKDDEVPLPDQTVQFESSEQGMSDTQNELTLKVMLSREATEAISVVIDLTDSGAPYGTAYTTLPAASNQSISLSIPKGSKEASFQIIKAPNLFLEGNESVHFKISSATAPALVGNTGSLTLKFASIVSEGSTIQLNGLKGSEAGSSAANAVFVDLSNNQQTAAERASWDLGFSNGEAFRVILNNLTSATAKVLDKNDLNQVTAADTIPSGNWSMGYTAESFSLVDDIQGDLSKTVIAEIASSDAENKVYILNPGTGGGSAARPWWKIRILRKGTTAYTLQYARIQDSTFKTIEITKGNTHHFQYVHLGDSGANAVAFSPAAEQWDFRWSYALYETALGATSIPYAFSDLIAINKQAGVTAAEVLTSTIAYADFKESNLTGISFGDNVYQIGANWRVTSSTTEPVGVRNDRFYLIKDPAGNVYKIKFLSFHANDGGERGRPKLEFELVKKSI